MPSEVTSEMIVAEAREWLGTRYMHQQRTKGKFADCVGLIIGVARRFGLGDYYKADYKKSPDPEHMGRELFRRLDVMDRTEPQLGDILWMVIRKDPQHLAIVGDYPEGGLSIIHAHSSAGRVVEHRLDDRWRGRIHAILRYRGVVD